MSLATVRAHVAAGEWFLDREDGQVRAALRFLWSDPEIWGTDAGRAGYVHGLMVDRAHAGVGLGAALLAWAEDRTRPAGRSVVRLDCVESNQRLREYYAGLGFREVGRRDFDGPWDRVLLLERVLC